MCGRFTLFAPAPVLSKMFDAPAPDDFLPRYNISPSQQVLAVREAAEKTGRREFALLRWGLVPSWADDPAIGNRLVNARAETADSRPAFRSAFRSRRCLLPASGFYEWRRLEKGKQPYFIRMRDGFPFALAGLWEPGRNGGAEDPGTCAILTTEANAVVSPIHDRMPVIVPPEMYVRWLAAEGGPAGSLKRLLAPYPPDPMEACPVGPAVNNPRGDGEECIAPVRGTFP